MSGRFSRLSNNSYFGRSQDQDGASEQEPLVGTLSPPVGPRSQSAASNNRSSSANLNLSSSLSQRIPARSFSHHVAFGSNDPAQYSSQGVRQETAELASWALADANSVRSGSPSQRPQISDSEQSGKNNDSANSFSDDSASTHPGRPLDSSLLPEVIEETSEPVSPDGDVPSTSKPPSASALTEMFRSPARHASAGSVRISKVTSRPTEDHSTRLEPEQPSEATPLLPNKTTAKSLAYKGYMDGDEVEQQMARSHKKRSQLQQISADFREGSRALLHVAFSPKTWSPKAVWEHGVKKTIGLLPCVFLGVLLNVLDALSYGIILFPLGEPIFAKTGPDGISMFYISCIVSQLVYSLGGSIFKGAVGSEMIEVVPFFHKMTYTIMATTGKSNPKVVLATVITSYAASSILTGLVFFLLGALKLGSLVNFFPRHILIGCIGGVGFFLFITGIEVSSRLEGNLAYNFATLKQLFQADTVALWLTPLGLAIILITSRHFIRSPYLVPTFFISVAAIFYIIVTAVPALSLDQLRNAGWVFKKVEAGVPFYHFYSYYDFEAVDWRAFAKTIPAMFALTFFGILHVPINVPALGIAAQEDDVNLNRELVAHGLSNAISGCVGSIQNYLVYVNSQMFIQNGGNTRLAGLLLAAATFGVLLAGPDMIGFVPIMVVGALIYYLGIELLQEALVDTWGKLKKLEYLTVLAIVLIMGIYDFVEGIFAGILLACLSYVVQTSQKSAIRATFSGEVVESTVRRHPMQRHFLHEVGYQIYVTKLAGYLFFGSIVHVEKNCRALIEEEAFRKQPIRYLVFDLAHVNGMDYSAAEAFERLERVLGRREVILIFSGIEKDDEVGKSLRSIGMWQDDSAVEVFEDLNAALEYCENGLLRAFYQQRDAQFETEATSKSSLLDVPKNEARLSLTDAMIGSPRQRDLNEAATSTLDVHRGFNPKKWQSFKQPLPLLLQAFQGLTDKNEDFWFHATSFFERKETPLGTVLYSRGDQSNGFYLLEEGILRADYDLPQGNYHESIVAGTTCGELPFFSETARTATVVAERDCIVWLIDVGKWEQLQQAHPAIAHELLKIGLKLTSERMNAITSYVLTTAG